MQSKQPKETDPFRVEERRDYYALKGDKRKFRSLYSNENPSIFNLNSGLMWDQLNCYGLEELGGSPIYNDKLVQVLKIIKNKRGNLLDIGFGNGIIERRLKNFRLYGIDISTKSVRNIKREVVGNFSVGSILDFRFTSSYFDVVLCLDVLEHISPKDTFNALGRIKRVMKPGSMLVLSVPLNEGLEQMVKEGGINPNAHVRVYSPRILQTELIISGFGIEKQILLSAFRRFYLIKKIINRLLRIKKANLLIVVAKKK